MTNVRRIQHYTAAKMRDLQATPNEKSQHQTPQDSFFAVIGRFLAGWRSKQRAHALVVGW
jgi:hypothetical protein